MTRAVRVDPEVQRELYRRRRHDERNHSDVIRRALEEASLEDKLRRLGLTTNEMARLADLRSLR